jgi:DNA-binding protein YbaB
MSTPNGLGHMMQSPDEAMASVDEWARGLTEKAERYQAVQARTEQIRLTSANSDGSVRVTVRADGGITGLELNGRARTMPLEELSTQILTTMHRAQAGIADEVSEVMAEELGDQDPETRGLMVDNLRSRFPDPDADEDDPEPEGPGPRAAGDTDGDGEDLPW